MAQIQDLTALSNKDLDWLVVREVLKQNTADHFASAPWCSACRDHSYRVDYAQPHKFEPYGFSSQDNYAIELLFECRNANVKIANWFSADNQVVWDVAIGYHTSSNFRFARAFCEAVVYWKRSLEHE